MDVLKRIVAVALVAIVAVATAVRPACAAACQRAIDRAASPASAMSRSEPASHCARMGHASPAAARIATAGMHPCGDHATLATGDARATRVDRVAVPALVEAPASIVASPPAPRLVDARRSGLPPPDPPRAPRVLRV